MSADEARVTERSAHRMSVDSRAESNTAYALTIADHILRGCGFMVHSRGFSNPRRDQEVSAISTVLANGAAFGHPRSRVHQFGIAEIS